MRYFKVVRRTGLDGEWTSKFNINPQIYRIGVATKCPSMFLYESGDSMYEYSPGEDCVILEVEVPEPRRVYLKPSVGDLVWMIEDFSLADLLESKGCNSTLEWVEMNTRTSSAAENVRPVTLADEITPISIYEPDNRYAYPTAPH